MICSFSLNTLEEKINFYLQDKSYIFNGTLKTALAILLVQEIIPLKFLNNYTFERNISVIDTGIIEHKEKNNYKIIIAIVVLILVIILIIVDIRRNLET